MKIMAGEITPDGGEIESQQGLKVARLTQEVPRDTDATVYDVVASGLGETGKLLIEYQPNFVDQIGVWKALTELYFNKKPTSGRIQRLKIKISKAPSPQFKQIDPWLLLLIRRMRARLNYLRGKIIHKIRRQPYSPIVLK